MDFLIKEIVDHKIPVSIDKDESGEYFYEVLTGAKSGMQLYIMIPNNQYLIKKRYGETDEIVREDWDHEGVHLIQDFLYSFKSCLHGRDFCNEYFLQWAVSESVIEVKTETKVTRTFS